MPEGVNFDELSSDHLFSLDLNALCSLDDVRERCFPLVALVANNSKASRGLRYSATSNRSLDHRQRGRGVIRK